MKNKKIKKKSQKIKRKQKKTLPFVSKYSHLLNKKPSAPSNVFDQVLEHFVVNVLQKPKNLKINQKSKLNDFCTDKKFEKEFKDMFVYRTQTFFGVSILRMYNEPILKIIEHLRLVKMKALYYNSQTIF